MADNGAPLAARFCASAAHLSHLFVAKTQAAPILRLHQPNDLRHVFLTFGWPRLDAIEDFFYLLFGHKNNIARLR